MKKVGKLEGWKVEKLGDVIQKTETINPLQTPNKEFIYIDISSVNNKTFSIEETSLIKGKDAPSRARKYIKAGDVIFATVRPTLKRVAIIPEEYDGQVCSTGYFVLRGKEYINNKFLFYFLLSDGFNERMKKLQKGASYPAVTDTEVKEQTISYPPISEQQQIVAVLDKSFTAFAIVKENAEKNLANAREIFESALQEAFANPHKGWTESNLIDVCEFEGGAQPPKSTFSKVEREGFIRFIQIRDYKTDNHKVYIPLSKARRFCKKTDIMIGRYGPPVFQILEGLDGAYNVALMKAIPNEKKVLRDYIFLFLKHRKIQQYIINLSQRASGQTGINIDALKAFPIRYPPLAEQRAIVGRLEALSAETGRLEEIYQQKVESLEELKKSVLAKAFEGEI